MDSHFHAIHIISNAPFGSIEKYLTADDAVRQSRHLAGSVCGGATVADRLGTSANLRRVATGGGRSGNSGKRRTPSDSQNSGKTINQYFQTLSQSETIGGTASRPNTPEEIEAELEETIGIATRIHFGTDEPDWNESAAAARRDDSDDSGGDSDTTNCTVVSKGGVRIFNGKRSPWKYISKHTGTHRLHYHIIYISTNKAWGYNSGFGKTIRAHQYKATQITCIACLLEYLHPNANRQTLRDILTEEDKRHFKCINHSLGIYNQTGQSKKNTATGNPQGRNNVLREQSPTLYEDDERMVDGYNGADETIFAHGSGRMESEQIQPIVDVQSGANRYLGIPQTGRFKQYSESNTRLVLLLCEHGAFDEGEAQRILCSTPEGIAAQFIKKFPDRLRTAISISKILVFQESAQQRIERCKQLQLKKIPHLTTYEAINTQVAQLESMLEQNYISKRQFAKYTKKHFYGLTKKKNNLFFRGPPSTGKTMLMESLVRMHFNYERLTGLTPQSSFNFSSLIHSNACFMDECKLTENQFEQWKLLAAGTPMATDVKYKSRHQVTNVRLYTASNYPIELYVSVPEAKEAIDTRTIEFIFNNKIDHTEHFFMTALAWEKFWETNKEHRLKTDEDEDDEDEAITSQRPYSYV